MGTESPDGWVGSMLVLSGQIDPDVLRAACGETPSLICREVLERTDSERLAEAVDILLARPLKIALVVVLAWVVVRLLRRIINRFVLSLSEPSQTSRRLKGSVQRSRIMGGNEGDERNGAVASLRASARAETLGYVLRSVSAVTIWTIAGLTILGELGLNLGPLVAGAGIVGVALGFGAQSLVKDFLAGIFIIIEDQYGVGDLINVDEGGSTSVTGHVESVSLRSTRLRAVDGTVWHVPNGTILRVGNMSQEWARALLDVSVGYNADIPLTEAVIKRVADGLWHDPDWSALVLEEPEVWGVEDLGADGVTIRLVVKTQPSVQFTVMRELRSRIKVALDEAGVEIPFPQRTVWVRRDPAGSVGVDSDDLDALAEDQP